MIVYSTHKAVTQITILIATKVDIKIRLITSNPCTAQFLKGNNMKQVMHMLQVFSML